MSQKTSKQGNYALGIRLCFPSKEKAETAARSAEPEFKAKHLKRSTTSIGIKNRIISININAKDSVALRATANSCLNSVILAKNISEV